MSRLQQLFFPATALYLLAVVVQFFLAGLGVFGETDFDAHSVFGWVLGIGSLVLLGVAVAARLGVRIMMVSAVLFGLNVLQGILANLDDVRWLAALHVVNALVIAFIGHALMQRARGYERAKMAA